MKSTVCSAVENMVKSEDTEVEFRIEAQAEALKENECIDARIGQWFEENDLEYLSAVLDLDDFQFGKRFPDVAYVTYDRRQLMKAEFRSHLINCTHCSLKHGFDLEMDSRIMRVCRNNRSEVLQLLSEEDTDQAESDHQTIDTWTNNSEHHIDIHREPEIILEPVVEPI